MSHGPGRIQRNILSHLEVHGDSRFGAIVAACEPGGVEDGTYGYSIRRNTYESYRRAMRSLEGAGQIKVARSWSYGHDWLLSVAANHR